MYKHKYLKYKNKYLNLKDELSGGAIIDHLGELKKGEINVILPKLPNCKLVTDIFRNNPNLLLDTDFAKLPSIEIDITELNMVQYDQCNILQNEMKKNECNKYYYKCSIKQLFDKYRNILYNNNVLVEPAIYNRNTLNQILLRTMPNNTPDPNKVIDQQNLIRFGAYINDIDDRAFQNNQLTDIRIPSTIRTIGNYAFYNNRLREVTIPDSVLDIGSFAFCNNQLTEVTIPNSVINIGAHSFYSNQLREVTISNAIINISNHAFCNNQLVQLIIPISVINIGNHAFTNNQLTELTIPNSVVNIGRSAFTNNLLTKVTISDSVRTIGDYAFSENQFVQLRIPNSVETIGENAFVWNRRLIYVTLPRRFEQQPQLLRIFGPNYRNIHFTYT
jgi:hypothetical protein